MKRFYLDTAIIRDYYESREDKFRPLGEWAFRLLAMIKANGFKLIVSDIMFKELGQFYSKEVIDKLFAPFKETMERVEHTYEQYKEAKRISSERGLPLFDALHAIIARDTDSVLITRDNHFLELTDIIMPYKPEDII